MEPGRRRLSEDLNEGRSAALRTIHQAITESNTRLGNEVTGLPHRGQILLALEAMIQDSERQPVVIAVVSIQVRRVHALATSLGFGASDALAQCMADRLRAYSKANEWGAHIGGAEFVWVAAQAISSSEAEATQQLSSRVQGLRSRLSQVAELQELSVLPDCRFGVSLFPRDSRAGNQLLLAAKAAQQEDGTARGLAGFEHRSQQASIRELHIESALPLALQHDELALVYMPLVELRHDSVLGVEALLRWHSPHLGDVSPAELVPVAERSGLIAEVGRWVLRRALGDLAALRQQSGQALKVFINVSVVQLQISDFKADVAQTLQELALPADCLNIELKEDVAGGVLEACVEQLQAICAMGVGVVLDDFGKGKSGLNRLTQLPLDGVKVDHTVVEDINVPGRHASMTRAAIHLAHELQLTAYADGVETVEQMRHLLDKGCDVIQGWGIGKPMPASDLWAWMQTFARSAKPWRDATHTRGTLLIVDDEASILSALKRLFRREGYLVLTASDGASGLELLKTQPVDVIVSDQRMPEMLGVDFLRQARLLQPDTIRMTLSGFADLQSIIDAVNEGAIYRFLMKPWEDDRLKAHVEEAMAACHLRKENRELQEQVGASNRELAQSNRRLALSLRQQFQRVETLRDGASSAHELLDRLPLSIVGLDAERSVVYINQRAMHCFPHWIPSLGQAAPPELQELLALCLASPKVRAEGIEVEIAGHTRRVQLCEQACEGRGGYLIISPCEDPPGAPV
ncbi:MAG: hypothetical protein C4K60_01100 [Ideonella sp. MAG2]|nr:MAG: hypothetical protein C4K60_01100 [Ideonella sp. MAG2]